MHVIKIKYIKERNTGLTDDKVNQTFHLTREHDAVPTRPSTYRPK